MSSLGWVDFSSDHRERVKSVIDQLSAPGVIDELGIGVIRDSFSDELFPGLSTIQTRAKYYVTIPRIFKDYEKLAPRVRRKLRLESYLMHQENLCMQSFVSNHESDPQPGIIGESFAGKQGEVQRKPSSVYWTGIRLFRIVRTNLSLSSLCRRFANPDQPLHDLIAGSDKMQGDDQDALGDSKYAIATPDYPDDWIESLSLHLSKDEASFLSQQISSCVPNSLLGQLLLDPKLRQSFVSMPSEWGFTDFAGQTPFLDKLPDHLLRVIFAARDFWQLLYGAHIRYNCLIQEKAGQKELLTDFNERWEKWLSDLGGFDWKRWNTALLWQLASKHNRWIKDHTVVFVDSWINGIQKGASTDTLDKLVVKQEINNKRIQKARLYPSTEVSENAWVGIADLNYRINVARAIIRDIDDGLDRKDNSDA